MSGTLEIADGVCWLPPGWVFDNVLESIARAVETSDPKLAARLRDVQTTTGGGFLSIRELSLDQLRTIAHGLESTLHNAVRAGPERFHDQAFFEAYIEQTRSLSSMLNSAIYQRPTE